MTINATSETSESSIGMVLNTTIDPDWKAVAAKRKEDIYSAIPSDYLIPSDLLKGKSFINLYQTCGIFTERELLIISLTATNILKGIQDQILTAVEVTKAFCKSAAISHQATNCLAWVMFDQALKDAEELDAYMKLHKKLKGPLHGLPISVKEHIYLKGTPSTSGFIAWANDFCEKDEDEALVLKVLREAGAVFYVKTTNPQSLMALETTSNLYSTTTNPHNTNLSPGGSSGGEAALIAMRGSVLGIGTDIGGSIRVPAAFCGLYGLKPSVSRLPHSGLSGCHGGMENIIGVVGPIATCIKDLRLFCKVLLDSSPWHHEPSLIPLPWKSSPLTHSPTKLKIGIIHSDNLVLPHPPITRCLNETVAALGAAGHEMVEWDTSLHKELIECVDNMYFLDGGREYRDIMENGGEAPVELLKWILGRDESKKFYSAVETWKLNAQRNRLQTAYAKLWNDSKVDIILCPTNPSVASAHNESKYWGYSTVWNILDYPVCVLPIGEVKKGDAWSEDENENERKGRKDGYWGQGKEGAKKYEGAKVAIQVVGRRLEEEKLLTIVERVVEDLSKFGEKN